MLGTTNEFGKWPRKEKKNITGVLRKQISPCKPHPLPPGKALEDDTECSLPGMSRHEFSKQGAPLLRRVLGKSITSEGLLSLLPCHSACGRSSIPSLLTYYTGWTRVTCCAHSQGRGHTKVWPTGNRVTGDPRGSLRQIHSAHSWVRICFPCFVSSIATCIIASQSIQTRMETHSEPHCRVKKSTQTWHVPVS